MLPGPYDAWRTWYPEPSECTCGADDDREDCTCDVDPCDDMGASDAAYERWLEE